MQGRDIRLLVIAIVAVVIASILARTIAPMRDSIVVSKQLKFASRVPLAGFQKFLADIMWMRYIQYAGSEQLNKQTAPQYESYIRRIIALDPNFYRAYYDGFLFLGPVDIDRALKIVEMIDQHPVFKKTKWEIQLYAGQLLMRDQWRNYYAGKELDEKVLQKALNFYQKAKDIPGRRLTALNNYVRTLALKDSMQVGEEGIALPRELHELRQWCAEYRKTSAYGESMDPSGMYIDEGATGETFQKKVMEHIRKIAKEYLQNPNVNDKLKQIVEKTIQETIQEFFPERRFDWESYVPYDTSTARYLPFYVENVQNKTYIIELDAPTDFAVGTLRAKLGKGSAVLSVLIDGQPIEGLSNLTATEKKEVYPALMPLKLKKRIPAGVEGINLGGQAGGSDEAKEQTIMVYTPLRKNKGKKGSVLELKVEQVNNAQDLNVLIEVYSGSYF